MKNINGTQIKKLSFVSRKLGDLLYYEGPLLSLYVDVDDPDVYYFYKWTDCDEVANRWMITQVNEVIVTDFFLKQASLRSIILKNPIAYMIDLDDDLKQIGILVASTEELPEEYLPDVRSYFVEERYTDFAKDFMSIIMSKRDNDSIGSPFREPLEEQQQISESLTNYNSSKLIRKEKLVDVLNDLIHINNERMIRYEKAVEESEYSDADLMAVYNKLAEDSRRFSVELRQEIVKLGVEPVKDDITDYGKLYRVWMDIRAAFSGHDRHSVLSNNEYGEDAAQKAYNEALKSDTEMSADIRYLIVEQKAKLKEAHELIKRYKESEIRIKY